MKTTTSGNENIEVPPDMVPDIRTNHAGESGAVSIYRSILRYCSDPALREFATRHLGSEEKHLEGFGALLQPDQRSRIVFAWRLAGAGAVLLLSLLGPRAVYAAIEAVEDGVDRHFQAQIDKIAGRQDCGRLRELLESSQADERRHRDEAAVKMGAPGPGLKIIDRMVNLSSAVAVAVTRRI